MKHILAIIALLCFILYPSQAAWNHAIEDADSKLNKMFSVPEAATASFSATPLVGGKSYAASLGAAAFTLSGGAVINGSFPDSVAISPVANKFALGATFNTDSLPVEIAVRQVGGFVSLYCDGQLIGTQTVGTSTAIGYYRWTFSTYRHRKIHAVVSYGAQFAGVNVSSTAALTPAPLKYGKKIIAIFGASTEYGWGADCTGTGAYWKLAQILGINIFLSAQNGTGYITDGSTQSYTNRFANQIAALQAAGYEVVAVILTNGNGDAVPPATLSTGVQNLVNTIRTTLPNAIVLGVLPLDIHGGPMFANQRAGVLAGFQAANVPFVDPFVPGLLNTQNASTIAWTGGQFTNHLKQNGYDEYLRFLAPGIVALLQGL